jgi:hypothetical protein
MSDSGRARVPDSVLYGTDALTLTAGTVDSRPGIIEGRKPLPMAKITFTATQTIRLSRTIEVPDSASIETIESTIADIVYVQLTSGEWEDSIAESAGNQEHNWEWDYSDYSDDTDENV